MKMIDVVGIILGLGYTAWVSFAVVAILFN